MTTLRGYARDTLEDLLAIPPEKRVSGLNIKVLSLRTWFQFEAEAATGGYTPTTGTGRWFRDSSNTVLAQTSTTSNSINTGSKTFNFNVTDNLGWLIGTRLRAANSGTDYIEGVVTALTNSSVTLDIDNAVGSGTFTGWNITIAGDKGSPGAGGSGSSTDDITEGSTNLYFTAARVLNTLLTGFSVASSLVAVATTDTVLQAFGKIQALLNSKTDKLLVINQQTASYTLVLGDADKLVEMNVSTAANNLTIPPNSGVAFPIGTQILISQYGTGQVTIVGGSGVTLKSDGNKLKISAQYCGVTLVKRNIDEWYVFGSLAA